MASIYYKSTDGRYYTDLDPQAGELWVTVGPAPLHLAAEVAADDLPDGWQWVTDAEWEADRERAYMASK